MPLQVLAGPVIQAGESLSNGLDCSAGTIVRVTMPATWTGANLSFQVSADGAAFNDLFTVDGREIVIPVVAGSTVLVEAELHGVAFIKVRSGARQYPVPQAEIRTFQVVISK